MTQGDPLTGAEFLARTLAANGTTHVFFIDAVLRRTLIELGTLGVTRVLAHAEKSAAYMADGYARVAGRPGICFAQSVGAANMAAGLQDAYLGRSPVIALTGRKQPAHQQALHRHGFRGERRDLASSCGCLRLEKLSCDCRYRRRRRLAISRHSRYSSLRARDSLRRAAGRRAGHPP